MQPDFESGADAHALELGLVRGLSWSLLNSLMTFCMFIVGVSIKIVLLHDTDDAYARKYAT